MLEDSVLTSKFCFPRWHLTECIYPDLFSAETLKCENFTTVTCGSRQEHKWLCKFVIFNNYTQISLQQTSDVNNRFNLVQSDFFLYF